MAEQAKEDTGIEKLAVIADRGYFSSGEVLSCDQAGIAIYAPEPLISGAKAHGRSGKQDFIYLPDRDEYRCPAGHAMSRRFERVDKGLIIDVYATPECRRFLLKPDCTTGPDCRIKRFRHGAVIDAMQEPFNKASDQTHL